MVEISELDLIRLIGKFLRELLSNKDLSRDDLLKIAEALESGEKVYYGDPQPCRIKRR